MDTQGYQLRTPDSSKGAECIYDQCVGLNAVKCMPQGCLPCAAWRACHPAQALNKRAGAALALGWGQQVLLLDVPLVRPNLEGTAGALCLPFAHQVDASRGRLGNRRSCSVSHDKQLYINALQSQGRHVHSLIRCYIL